MSKKEEEEEVYRLTLKGLISLNLEDIELAGKIVDTIELYLRRHHSKGGHPAIVFNMDDNRFDFVTLSNSEDE
jgi:hypothetical protein|tara:strand:- start:1956 stop:2174 length:219 start_codon:yes stop_codon:yes gene_type:complete